MSGTPSFSMVIISLALVFYSVGVWANFFSRRLQWWHWVMFVLGLICDGWGTLLMMELTGGKMALDVHYISGTLAFLLMLVNVIRALVVLLKKDEKAIRSYHKFAMLVWFIWLIPWLSPMFFQLAPASSER